MPDAPNFRDAVAQVQADARAGNLTELERVLHDPNAERAARLASANQLARMGEPGQNVLLTAMMFTDGLSKVASARAYFRAQGAADEAFLVEAAHSKERRVRRAIRRLIKERQIVVSDDVRLRCYLPLPYRHAPNPGESLAGWFSAPNLSFYQRYELINAIGVARYAPAAPLLIKRLENTKNYEGYYLNQALKRIGASAIPALIAARPHSIAGRDTIDRLLVEQGQEATVRAFWPPSGVLPPLPEQTALDAAAVMPDPVTGGIADLLRGFWNRLRGQ